MSIKQVKIRLRESASTEKAKILSSFFKTGPGQYGEGDIFIGVTVPQTRAVAKAFADLPPKDLLQLLASKVHEERLCALLLLVHRFEEGTPDKRQAIVALYLKNTRYVNNWDLVDLSAPKILGSWLITQDRSILYKLARSADMWERRIAIVATLAFIRKNDLKDTFRLADMLLKDTEDLMHKAVGWMLREAGKRNQSTLENFLKSRYKRMPRTMLRYAIERFPKAMYRAYLDGKI